MEQKKKHSRLAVLILSLFVLALMTPFSFAANKKDSDILLNLSKSGDSYDTVELSDNSSFEIDNENIATISVNRYGDECEITGRSEGSTTLTGYDKETGDKYTWRVIVYSKTIPWIEFEDDEVEVEIDDYINLDCDCYPSSTDLDFKSSDPNIAKVNSAGRVTGVSTGTVTITAYYNDITETCKVKVVDDSDFRLDKTSMTLDVGKSRQLNVNSKWSNSDVYWSSDDEKIASVDSYGNVTGEKAGVTTIRAELKRDSGVRATCRVSVQNDGGSGTVKYTLNKNGRLELDEDDFNDLSEDICDSKIDYIQFTEIPSSSRGILYYRYGSNNEKLVSRNNSYYRSGNYLISDLTFVPEEDYTGTVEFSFDGYANNGTKIKGTLSITVNNSDGDVVTNAAAGSNVKLDASEFNKYCREKTGKDLDYIRFETPTKGMLYYLYEKSGEKRVSDATLYYYEDSPYIEDITYVPDNKTVSGNISVSFTGWDEKGNRFTGTYTIKYTEPTPPKTITYVTRGTMPVQFVSADFESACSGRGAGELKSVRFSQPDSRIGTLFYDYSYGSYNQPVFENSDYTPDDNNLIGRVFFVADEGYSGTVTVKYTGTDKNGLEYDGTVSIIVGVAPTNNTTTNPFVDYGDQNDNTTTTQTPPTTPTTPTAPSTPDTTEPGESAEPQAVGGFPDVLTTDYFAVPVKWAIEKQITEGHLNTVTGEITFAPNLKCTTSQIITFLWRAVGSPKPTIVNPFSDVPANEYYADAAVWAYEKGLVNGTIFRPEAPCTRSETVKYLWILEDRPAAPASEFADVPVTADYSQAVSWAVEKGITNGVLDTITKQVTFAPDKTCTRGQIVTFLWRDLAEKEASEG